MQVTPQGPVEARGLASLHPQPTPHSSQGSVPCAQPPATPAVGCGSEGRRWEGPVPFWKVLLSLAGIHPLDLAVPITINPYNHSEVNLLAPEAWAVGLSAFLVPACLP